MTENKEYITQDDAAETLGVARGTLYYYMKILKIEKFKFPLDKHVYLAVADVERIRSLKESAVERNQHKAEDKAA